KLTKMVRAAGPLFRVPELLNVLRPLVPGDNAQIVADMLAGLALANWHHHSATETFDPLIGAVTSAKAEWPEEEWKKLNAVIPMLRELVGLENIALLGKALALQSEQPSIFLNVHILTDMRPIFTSMELQVAGALVTQTLR